MARTPAGRGFIPITQGSCLKDQASSWYPLMQSRLGCVLWSLQPKDHQPESGVLSATSFSLCVSVLGFLSPREQGLPSAFRVPKSFIKPGALELGSPWALWAPSQELSTSLPADHQKVRAPHPTWSFHACAYHRPKSCLDFPVPQGTPFSVSPIQSLPASQTCPSASSSPPVCIPAPLPATAVDFRQPPKYKPPARQGAHLRRSCSRDRGSATRWPGLRRSRPPTAESRFSCPRSPGAARRRRGMPGGTGHRCALSPPRVLQLCASAGAAPTPGPPRCSQAAPVGSSAPEAWVRLARGESAILGARRGSAGIKGKDAVTGPFHPACASRGLPGAPGYCGRRALSGRKLPRKGRASVGKIWKQR